MGESRPFVRSIAIGLAMVLLAGCGGPKGDFLDGLNAETETPVCIDGKKLGVMMWESEGKSFLSSTDWDTFSTAISGPPMVAALDKLIEHGYVAPEAEQMQRGYKSVDIYALTSKGAEHFVEGKGVCVAEKHADEIVSYTEPGDGGMAVSQVKFKYSVDVNDLVTELGIEEEVRNGLSRQLPGEGDAAFVKTNEGWQLQSASWSGI